MNRLLAFFVLLLTPELYAQIEKCSNLENHGKRDQANVCYLQLVRSGDALTRAEADLALHKYPEAEAQFNEADREHPNSAAVQTSWGNLYLRLDRQVDGAKHFQEAIKIDSSYAPAYVGLGRLLSANFDKDSVHLAKEALEHNPKYFPAHELLSYLALEEGNTSGATEEAQRALATSPDALYAMAILASIDILKGNGVTLSEDSPWMARLLKVNPYYGTAYATAGHFLEINYRYTEAIAAYRKAIDLDPSLSQARSDLGVNLMRTGQTSEAQKQLAVSYHEHFQNPETINSLRFLDKLDHYQTFSTKSADIVLDKSEAPLLRPYIESELQRAMATYEKKYNMKLPERVRLEVYPSHDDFVVRTLGLPGLGGLLGVTFGTVVAIDSPSARPAGEFSWADTMWHEMCHVYVITATHHLVPRWFSEGLAVHEEGVASSRWGNRLTPETIAAIKQRKLLAVLDLDAGFVRPQYEGQVRVSYYEAGEICDYIVQRWGDAAILGMIRSYAAHENTRDAIQENLRESPETFDKDFRGWLEKRTEPIVSHFDQWKSSMTAAANALKKGDAPLALEQISAVQKYYPGYPETFDELATCFLALGKKTEAMSALEQYQVAGGTGISQLKQLAQLETDASRPEKAIAAFEEIDQIYPEDQETHERLGGLLLKNSKPLEAIQEYRAVLTLKPSDVAASHLNLARALTAAHQNSEAKDQVLLALEVAPNYKPAQQLLLQLSQ